MTVAEQKKAAKQFAIDWADRGDEKQDTQAFWMTLLQKIFEIEEPEKFISFEVPVKLDHTSFIDAYIESTHVLIEQKGRDIDLRKGYKQSDGSMLTPFQQARRYAGYLPHNQNPRWIIVCNFQTFEIHDMNHPNSEPEIVLLQNLKDEFHRLQFLVDQGNEYINQEMKVSLQAGELVGELYDALLKQYKDPESEKSLRSLNMLCVRLVFCLYAEDAGIFGHKAMFHNYLERFAVQDVRKALVDLFQVLDQKPEDRDPYLTADLAAFPYVNGGLFADEHIEIPLFNEEIVDLLLRKASEDFNWSEISPTIFGAVFESTLNPETRRSGGMHYTSIENIHKVIDPLFLNNLQREFDEICSISILKTKQKKLKDFQKKLSAITILDPACGSGNFLTESYLSLRRLENEALREQSTQVMLGEYFEPIQVSISQFYGIEINDFAVSVAKTALWIAEAQMMQETSDIVHMELDFLPLETNAYITEGNALRIDWESVVPKKKLTYIVGNPPFVSKAGRTSADKSHSKAVLDEEQKKDKLRILGKTGGILDYVACWFKLAAQFIQETDIKVAFVATDSICQGQQVAPLWEQLLDDGVKIHFAYRFFKWITEAHKSATVFVVIVGFGATQPNTCTLFDGKNKRLVNHISPYLLDTPDILVRSRNTPICNVPPMCSGNQPIDGGHYIFKENEYNEFIKKEPNAEQYMHLWYGADEFLKGKKRFCLYLGNCEPDMIYQMPLCYKRVQAVQEFRLNSDRAGTQRLASTPTRFQVTSMPSGHYIALPEVSAGSRRYIPMGFLDSSILCSNKMRLVPDASLYHFGVLTSNVHMAWVRTVGGYYGPSYQYSVNIIYNSFPWPTPTDIQKAKIEQTAQAILDARSLYPNVTLEVLYNEVTMPPELRKAHQANDKAVMAAYGFDVKTMTESSCVAELMKMYQKLTEH